MPDLGARLHMACGVDPWSRAAEHVRAVAGRGNCYMMRDRPLIGVDWRRVFPVQARARGPRQGAML